jgi:hypothetical protein
MEEEKTIVEMRLLFAKGQTNPSACAAIMYYKGFEGRFVEIRKIAEYQYKLYSMEQAAKKRELK